MKLAGLYAAALQDAQTRAAQHPEGKSASSWVPLPKGAQFAVQLSGGRICVWLSRQHKPVGYPAEEATFCKHFGVPARARRVDHGRMSDGWYKVSYAWEIAEALPAEATQQELAPAADADLPQLAPAEAKVPAPAASHVTQLLAEGEALPGDL